MSNRKNLISWEIDYIENNVPWNSLEITNSLKDLIEKFTKPKQKLLEIGCGQGNDSNELSKFNLSVTGLDISKKAIEIASSRYNKITFEAKNFFDLENGKKFHIIYDKGVFHNLNGDKERNKFIEKVATHLEKRGVWINISGSADKLGENIKHGKVFLSDISRTVEPYFEILYVLKAPYGRVEGNIKIPAWYSVFKLR